MRRSIPIMILLLAAGCSRERQPEQRSEELQAFDVTEEAAPAPSVVVPATRGGGPNVGPTAAPGVAFNYLYAFRLPAEQVAAVQERHARACESLGVSRCRITGMRYRVINERDIEAMLAFKLDPAIARQFGQQGVAAVTEAEGMLVESEISGTDVGTTIRTAGRNIAEMTEELSRLEAELARGGKSTSERQQLEYQAQQLRQSIRAQQATREEQQESLANTPMVFRYGSGDLVPGPQEPSFGEAARRAWDNFLQGLIILFVIAVTLLPWLLLGLLGWWIVRAILRRLRGARAAASPIEGIPPAEVSPSPAA